MKRILSILSALAVLAGTAPGIETILAPASIADATEGGQTVKDISAFKGQGTFVLTALNTAGSTPTCNVKLQSAAGPVIDDSIMTGTTAGTALRINTNDNIKLAASFSTGSGETPTIYQVVLPLKKHATLTSGTLTLSVLADSSGPTGSALCSGTFNLANLTDSFTGATFTMTKPFTTVASTKYWLVLEGDYNVDGTANVTWRTSTVGSGGNSSVFDSSWSAGATTNFNHINYVLNFADVTNGAFTEVTTTAGIQEKVLNTQNLGDWVRAHVTITGTSTPAYTLAIGLLNR